MPWHVVKLTGRTLYGETWQRVTESHDDQAEAYIDLMALKDQSNDEYRLQEG